MLAQLSVQNDNVGDWSDNTPTALHMQVACDTLKYREALCRQSYLKINDIGALLSNLSARRCKIKNVRLPHQLLFLMFFNSDAFDSRNQILTIFDNFDRKRSGEPLSYIQTSDHL